MVPLVTIIPMVFTPSLREMAADAVPEGVAVPFTVRTNNVPGRVARVAFAEGVNVGRLRLTVLLCSSLLAATAVAFVGIIGFIGLVGPHIARMLVGEDQRVFLPMSALTGALLMSLTSIVSKTLVPGVLLPVGIITALIGLPFFVSLILKSRREVWG